SHQRLFFPGVPGKLCRTTWQLPRRSCTRWVTGEPGQVQDQEAFQMPFRNNLEFDLDTRAKMAAAYDAALVRLGIDASNPMSSQLAATIVGLAREGTSDVAALCEAAVAKLRP